MTCNHHLPPLLDITLELNPPLNQNNVPVYINKIAFLLKYTKSFSISSHPISESISGFDRSFELARSILSKVPDAEILFHITCKDINKVNIFARLTLLRTLEISKILVVTGEQYELPESNQELFYINSKELVDDILANYNWFRSVSIAGYPGYSLQENQVECERLNRKISSGVDSIYTQCVSSADQYKEFEKMMKSYNQSLNIVPSIAIFRDLNHLKRISRLMRVKPNEQLINELDHLDQVDSDQYSKDFLVNLCKQLKSLSSSSPIPGLNICTFNSFKMTEEVLKELGLKSEPVNC